MDRLKLKPLGALLLVGGFLLLWVLFRQGNMPLFQHTQTIEGVVVERYTTQGRRAGSPGTSIKVRCTAFGREQLLDREVDDEFWEAHPPKAVVSVKVRGPNMRSARIEGASNDEVWVWVKTVGGIVAMVLGVCALVYDRWFK